MIPMNAETWRRAGTGWDSVHELLAAQREVMVADPLAASGGLWPRPHLRTGRP